MIKPDRIRSVYWFCCLVTFACFLVCSAEAFLVYPAILKARVVSALCVSGPSTPAPPVSPPKPELTESGIKPLPRSNHSEVNPEPALRAAVRSTTAREAGTPTAIHSITVEQAAVPATPTGSVEVRQLSAEEADQEAGDAAFREGNFKDAVDDYRQSLELNAKNAAVWNRLGMAYEGGNDPKNAIDAYEHAIQLDPKLLEAQDNLRRLHGTTSPD